MFKSDTGSKSPSIYCSFGRVNLHVLLFWSWCSRLPIIMIDCDPIIMFDHQISSKFVMSALWQDIIWKIYRQWMFVSMVTEWDHLSLVVSSSCPSTYNSRPFDLQLSTSQPTMRNFLDLQLLTIFSRIPHNLAPSPLMVSSYHCTILTTLPSQHLYARNYNCWAMIINSVYGREGESLRWEGKSLM